MNAKTFSRRSVLRAAGGITVGLPFLETFAPRKAHAQAAKKRLIIYFTPEGTKAGSFYPTGTETNFTMGPIGASLEPFKKDLLVFKGIDHTSCKEVGSGHETSMVHALTAGGGDSIDQLIAGHIGKGSRITSLELGVRPRNINEKGNVSYSGGKMVLNEFNPLKVYARMFTGGVLPTASATGPTSAPAGDVQQIFARRKSVVDFVKGQMDSMKKSLSQSDRLRIDDHIAAIRDVEKSLTVAPEVTANANCGKPELMLVEGKNTTGPYEAVAQNFLDLMVLALACNHTNVITLLMGNSGMNEGFAFLGVPPASDGLHGWVHNDKGNPKFPEYAAKAFTWYAERYAYFLGRLKSINEGDKTLLDNSAVVWTSHFGNGGAHGPTDVPWVIAGSAGGAIKTGRFLNHSGSPQPHSRVMIGLGQAFGLNLSKMGNPKYGTAPVPGMLA